MVALGDVQGRGDVLIMPLIRAVRSPDASSDANRVLQRSRKRSEPIRVLPRLAANAFGAFCGDVLVEEIHSL